jgi:hypothetical protein
LGSTAGSRSNPLTPEDSVRPYAVAIMEQLELFVREMAAATQPSEQQQAGAAAVSKPAVSADQAQMNQVRPAECCSAASSGKGSTTRQTAIYSTVCGAQPCSSCAQ